MYKINCPLWVQVSKNKRFMLNLNQYRNAHHFTLNNAKREFENDVMLQVLQIKKQLSRFKLVYTLYKNDKRKCDTNNICTIVDKFFCDVLIKEGRIKDDNYNYLTETTFKWGGIDPENPRVEVQIIPIDEDKEQRMKLVKEAGF